MCGFRLERFHLIFLCILTGLPSIWAQNYTDPFSNADSVLNSTYKQALARVSPQSQETLRRAERAWIKFSDKQEAVLNVLQQESLLPKTIEEMATIEEVRQRSNHLKIFFTRDFINSNQSHVFPDQQHELEQVYAKCLSRLSSKHQQLLKEAERAWIEYRHADIDAAVSVYPLTNVQAAARAHLTSLRVTQLTELMRSVAQATPTPIPTPSSKIAVPDPEYGKAMSQTLAESKALIITLLSKKDDPFFKKADSIKNLPDLPADVSDAVRGLTERFDVLTESEESQKLLESGIGEYRTIALLSAWTTFTRLLKMSDVVEAVRAINSAIELRPKAINADYALLWQTAESWKPIYVKAAADYQEHVKKAKSLTQLGKNSDAIREYEAAFSIIENSTIPVEIKKLREQSLGL